MHDGLAARHRAIALRLAGRPVQAICAAVGRSKFWFHKWWGRYLQAGPPGLYDLTRANHHVAQRIPPELQRAIHAELKGLAVRPLPCERTVERVLKRNHVTAPRVHHVPPAAAPGVPRPAGPGL